MNRQMEIVHELENQIQTVSEVFMFLIIIVIGVDIVVVANIISTPHVECGFVRFLLEYLQMF